MTPRRDYAALPYSPPPSPPSRSSSPPSTTYPPPRPTALERLAASHKGKGRALPDALESDAGEEGKGGMCFSLRFTEGEGDLVDLWVGERETVREVKQRVRPLTLCVARRGEELMRGVGEVLETLVEYRWTTTPPPSNPTRTSTHRRYPPIPLYCFPPLSTSQVGATTE
jgi:hypothetical protein